MNYKTYSVTETAEILGITCGTVISKLQRNQLKGVLISGPNGFREWRVFPDARMRFAISAQSDSAPAEGELDAQLGVHGTADPPRIDISSAAVVPSAETLAQTKLESGSTAFNSELTQLVADKLRLEAQLQDLRNLNEQQRQLITGLQQKVAESQSCREEMARKFALEVEFLAQEIRQRNAEPVQLQIIASEKPECENPGLGNESATPLMLVRV
jgi:hypothetical protein